MAGYVKRKVLGPQVTWALRCATFSPRKGLASSLCTHEEEEESITSVQPDEADSTEHQHTDGGSEHEPGNSHKCTVRPEEGRAAKQNNVGEEDNSGPIWKRFGMRYGKIWYWILHLAPVRSVTVGQGMGGEVDFACDANSPG
jgi:hypothetical protein